MPLALKLFGHDLDHLPLSPLLILGACWGYPSTLVDGWRLKRRLSSSNRSSFTLYFVKVDSYLFSCYLLLPSPWHARHSHCCRLRTCTHQLGILGGVGHWQPNLWAPIHASWLMAAAGHSSPRTPARCLRIWSVYVYIYIYKWIVYVCIYIYTHIYILLHISISWALIPCVSFRAT